MRGAERMSLWSQCFSAENRALARTSNTCLFAKNKVTSAFVFSLDVILMIKNHQSQRDHPASVTLKNTSVYGELLATVETTATTGSL